MESTAKKHKSEFRCTPRLLTDALEDKSLVKRTLGERIGSWMMDFWQDAVDFRVSYAVLGLFCNI